MADTLERDHIDAALGLLRADAGLTVYPDAEGNVPAIVADHYVRVYTSIERPTGVSGASNKLTGSSDTWVTRYYCHCVGPNEYSCAAVAGRVRVALLDVTPMTVPGRICKPIRQEADNPANRSEATGETSYDRLVVYAMRTSPA